MLVPHRGDADRIHLRVGEQLAVVGVAPLYQSIRSVSWTPSPMIGPILFRMSDVTHPGRLRRAYIEMTRPIAPDSISALAAA